MEKVYEEISTNEERENCSKGFGAIQLTLGLLLVVAATFGYAVLQDFIVLIPALMGALLLTVAVKDTTVCRDANHLRNAELH